jgi:isopropylmalate/homocitrate/citramalate synthase
MAIAQPGNKSPWYAPGRFRVSPINYADEVKALYDFPARLVIHEGTLRKVEHASGAPILSPSDKVEIARLLDGVGVQEIGANPGQYSETVKGDSEIEGVKAVCAAGLKLKVRVSDHNFRWIQGDFSDIDRYAEYGVFGVDLIIGSQATDVMWGAGASVDRVEGAVADALGYARRKGLDAGVMIADIGRIDLDQAVRQMNMWLDHGAERFHLVDSLSTLSPDATRYVVRRIRKALKRNVPTPYHVHNDFGMATACAIAAASAGAWPETSVNGFGDRGFASFEEVVVSLELLYGIDTGIDLTRLAHLSDALQRITRATNHPTKPITGEALWTPQFTTQYEEVLAGKDAIDAYISSYNPEVVGATLRMMWSANTLSDAAIRAKLGQMNRSFTAEDVTAIIGAVLEKLNGIDAFPVWISDVDVEDICSHQLQTTAS